MRVETNETEYCKVNVVYEADTETVKEKIHEAVSQLRKAKIPGFRPGKAPDHAIKAKCKAQIDRYVLQQMADQAYEDLKFEKNIKPIGQPEITDMKLDGNNFSIKMNVLRKPDFELAQYKDFEIPKPHFNRDVAAQVQESLQDLRLRFGDVAPYGEGDFVELGDQVTMDFSGTIDDEEFDGGSEEGQLYTIGENRFRGFDDNLLGMMPDDEREFDLTFPEDLPAIGGKTAHFKVKLHMGMKRKPCPLDDELAKKVGMKDLEEVKSQLRKIAEMKVNNTEKNMLRQQVCKRLVDGHDIQVPAWLLNMEAQQLAAQAGVDWTRTKEDERDVFLNQATDNVKMSLIIDSIREAENEAVLSDSEAINALKQRVQLQGHDPDKFIVEAGRNGQLAGLLAAMKDEFTLQWLINQSKVIE